MALEKLKKWIGTQAVSAFFDQLNDNVDITNAHMAESANKHIHSFGSNQYGRFVKYDDGTMICYGEIPQIDNIAFTSYGNGWRSGTFSHLLPSPFLAGTVAAVKINQLSLGYYGMWITERIYNLDRIEFRFYSIIGIADGKDSNPLTYMAVGRWR